MAKIGSKSPKAVTPKASPNASIKPAARASVGEEKKRPRGRPVDPDSERQRNLANKPAAPRPRGRPVDPDSERQRLFADRAARKLSGVGVRKPYKRVSEGRPINPNSQRQKALARKQLREERAFQRESSQKSK